MSTRQNINRLVNPNLLAADKAELEGSIELALLHRLGDRLAENSGNVSYRLKFRLDRQGNVTIAGWLESRLSVNCDFCLEPVQLNVRSELNLRVVDPLAELEELETGIDPLEIAEDGLDITLLIEDELLLSIPMVVSHSNDPENTCPMTLEVPANRMAEIEVPRESPFDILKTFKDR